MTNTGTVEATGTGTLDLQNATISGGTVKTVGSGDVIEATVGTSTIENTTSFSNAGDAGGQRRSGDLTGETITKPAADGDDNSRDGANGDSDATGHHRPAITAPITVDNGGTLDLENATITGGN